MSLPSAGRVLWLFVRLRASRLANTLARGKRTTNPALMTLVVIGMLFSFFSMHQNVLHGLVKLGDGYLTGLATYATVLGVAAWLMSLANRDFGRAEWDLEWLITLPLSKSRLMFLRIAERAVTNPIAVLAFVPLFILIVRQSASWYVAVPLGILVSVPMLAIIATLQTVVDTGFRVHLKPSQLKNLQGVFNIVAIATLYATLGFAGKVPPAVEYLRVTVGDLLMHTPTGWAVRAVSGSSWSNLALYVGSALLILAAGHRLLSSLLQNGVVAGSGRESGGRGVSSIDTQAVSGWRPPPMLRKELTLLARDRNYLVQTVLVPILMIALQVYLNGENLEGPVKLTTLAAFAFGMIAYAMLFSIFLVLRSEGAALWLLYTLPRPIERLVRDKALAWVPMVALYWLAFAIFAWTRFGFSLDYAWDFGIALFGVPIFMTLSCALGIYAFNPHEGEVEGRPNPTLTYLYLLMSAAYGSTFYQGKWSAFVSVVLIAMLAAALWQRATQHLKYLLDPTAEPPPRVSLADGLIATYGFFVLQLVAMLLSRSIETAFAIAGLIVFLGAEWSFRRRRVEGAPKYRTDEPVCAVLYGLTVGVGCAVVAYAYINWVYANGWFADVEPHETSTALLLTVVFAAPIFEEYIFRGIVFGGLRANLPRAVVVSALLFAVVHPPVAVAPVFLLGVANALLTVRFRGLISPVIAHATYNAAVVLPVLLSS